MVADRKVALQGWSGSGILYAALECADHSCTTKKRSRVCTRGNPNSDSEHSKEECNCQYIPKEDQILVIACKAQRRRYSRGPTIADLTAMVQQLHLENRRHEDQLTERKIEVEELRDDLHVLRRGLSAKMKRLYEATGHKDLY